MGMKEIPAPAISPLLIRNLITSLFIYADKFAIALSGKYKPLEILRYALVSFFLFFLRLLPSLCPSLNPNKADDYSLIKPLNSKRDSCAPVYRGAGDSGIARGLWQLLSIVNDIPVSSRKYEVVRSLAERIIDENQREDSVALREVNRAVLSAAFSKTLSQLEASVVRLTREGAEYGGSGVGNVKNMVLRAVRSVGDGAWTRAGMRREDVNQNGISAEKLAAEVLWLAQKLTACGFAEEAVERWASASNLAWFSLSAEPQLQGSMVKVSAFLFKQAKELGFDEVEEEKRENQRKTKKKMLISWLPLLCRASNGTDVPVLSMSERTGLEKILEDMIAMLGGEEEKEQVLSLWLHHFTFSPSSDWPNLNSSYACWCTVSRKQLLGQWRMGLLCDS